MKSEWFAGVDLGGTNTQIAIGTAAGELVAEDRIATASHAGPASVLQRIADAVNQLARPLTGSISGIGIGCPGLVDLHSGHARFFPNLPTHWRNVAIADTISSACGCPVRLLNDARAATLGELVYGRGRQRPDLSMAFFTIGTGIGGGLVHNGQLVLGPVGGAGELGHQTMVNDGPLCGCGNRGCLETFASGSAISAAGVRLLRSGLAPRLYQIVQGDADAVSPQTMAAAADAGDDLVAAAIDDAADYLGTAVANVVTIFHPQLIVLGGGVAAMGDRILRRVTETMRRRVGMFPIDDVDVELSALGSRAGVMGAVALASGHLNPTRHGRDPSSDSSMRHTE